MTNKPTRRTVSQLFAGVLSGGALAAAMPPTALQTTTPPRLPSPTDGLSPLEEWSYRWNEWNDAKEAACVMRTALHVFRNHRDLLESGRCPEPIARIMFESEGVDVYADDWCILSDGEIFLDQPKYIRANRRAAKEWAASLSDEERARRLKDIEGAGGPIADVVEVFVKGAR